MKWVVMGNGGPFKPMQTFIKTGQQAFNSYLETVSVSYTETESFFPRFWIIRVSFMLVKVLH